MRRQPLIIGGGPAGAVAAIRLAEAGHRPLLVERSVGPVDKVCGDFLGADAIERLERLGIDVHALGAMPIRRLRLIHRHRIAESALPFAAVGLSRRVLDAALLRRAREAGAELRFGQLITRVTRQSGGWRAHRPDDAPIEADAIFIATGKHDLRDLPRPGTAGGSVGMKMYYRLSPAQAADLGAAIELILFPGGYAGLQCVDGGRAVLCVAVRRTVLRAIGGTWNGLIEVLAAGSRPMGERLDGATPLLARPLAVAGIPYGFLHRAHSDARLFRLGDQAAVIPSLTGDGIAIALFSGALAAAAWNRGDDAPAFHHALSLALGRQIRLASQLQGLAVHAAVQGMVTRLAGWFPGMPQRFAAATRIRYPTEKSV